jgi:hypothetical protein
MLNDGSRFYIRTLVFAECAIDKETYRKHHNDILLALHHNRKIEPHFQPLERLMDKDVLDRSRWDEPR